MTDKQIIHGEQVPLITLTRQQLEEDWFTLWELYKAKEQECETLANQLDFEVQKKECLEQECEELKETFDGLFKVQYKLADNNKKLRQCLTEIKEMLKEICMEECLFDWNKTSKKHCGDCDCRYGQILQKISECEGNDEL